MDYGWVWVDDPHTELRETVGRSVPGLFAPKSDVELQALMRVKYRAMEAVGGFFYASGALMSALITEMESQALLSGDLRMKLEMQAEPIATEEIEELLDSLDSPHVPSESHPEIVSSEAEDRIALDALARGSDYVTGPEAVMKLSELQWAREWIRWLAFLDESRLHGGITSGGVGSFLGA